MSHPVIEVSVVSRRVPLVNRWVSEKWEIEAIGPPAPRDDPGAVPQPGATTDSSDCEALSEDRFLWHGFRMDLHPSEAEGYYLNLREAEPKVFVMWRMDEWQGRTIARPCVVTASYNEAARMMDAGESVDAVAMPVEILAWIEPWLIANYKPEPRKKKQRNQAFWGDGEGGRKGGSDGRGDARPPESGPLPTGVSGVER